MTLERSRLSKQQRPRPGAEREGARHRSILLAVALACAAPAWLAYAHDPIGRRVTWTGDIARIVAGRCVRCHSEGGRGPMSLETYEDARPWARAMREEVLARRMPKWHAARGYGEFRNDPSLSSFEITLIAAWVDGGAPRGPDQPPPAAVDAPAPPVQPLDERTVECGRHRIPAGELLGLRPVLERGESVGITVQSAGAPRIVLAWIRNYDPDFPETYWLRTPLRVRPGSEILTEGAARCSVTLSFTAPRSRTGR